MEPTPRKLISIVTPVYNEADNVAECVAAVRRVFAELPAYDYEHVFCDNASHDDTVKILAGFAASDPRIRIIVNARNFGPFRSVFNGVLATRGDATVVCLAADLQDPPEIIPEFVRQWEAGHEIVYGIRANREEGRIMRTTRKIYYRLVTRLADIPIPIDAGEFQLIDRVVVDVLRKCDDYYPFIRGMIASCGYRATGVAYTWKARKRGFSKNRLYHLIDQGLNGLVSFTNVPLRLALLLGFSVSFASVLIAVVSFVVNLIFYQKLTTPGIPTLVVSIFFLAGVQLFLFGVLGEYIAAIHAQVRKRPMVVERTRINFAPPPATTPPAAADAASE